MRFSCSLSFDRVTPVVPIFKAFAHEELVGLPLWQAARA